MTAIPIEFNGKIRHMTPGESITVDGGHWQAKLQCGADGVLKLEVEDRGPPLPNMPCEYESCGSRCVLPRWHAGWHQVRLKVQTVPVPEDLAEGFRGLLGMMPPAP